MNLELNIKILDTLECLVFLHARLSYSFKQSMSNFLEQKYPTIDLKREIRKLRAVNNNLVEPFLFLTGKLSEWYQLESEEKFFQQINPYYFDFIL